MTDIPDDIMRAARKVVIEDLGMDSPGFLQTSYIDCIAEAILAERERSRQLLSEAEKREKEARTKALEEVALWHDARVQEYTEQIAVNDAYLARGGRLSHESRANEYCDDMRSCHRRAADAFRALQSGER